MIIKSIGGRCVALKDSWLLVLSNEEQWHLLTAIRITGETQGQMELVLFLSTHLFC